MKRASLLAIRVVLSGLIAIVVGCSAVKIPATNEYQLTAYSSHKLAPHPTGRTLLITATEAIAGYDTNQMLYVKKPYQLAGFAKNAWSSPPAQMLHPLVAQSIQQSGYFHAVSTGPYTDGAQYRLDTQLVAIEQNFLQKPSLMHLRVKAVLTRVADSKIIASGMFYQNVPCPMDTPYGGVLAANKATMGLTAELTSFVVSHIK